jgi:hypothetical protein
MMYTIPVLFWTELDDDTTSEQLKNVLQFYLTRIPKDKFEYEVWAPMPGLHIQDVHLTRVNDV